MSIWKRAVKRFQIIGHSESVGDFLDNVTDKAFDCVAAMPVLLWLLHIVVVMGTVLKLHLRIYVLEQYPKDIAAMLPSILICYAIMLALLIGKNVRAGRTLRQFLKENPVYVFFLIAMTWMLLAVTVDGWTKITLLGDDSRYEGILSYWGYIAVLFFSASLIKNDKVKRFLCDVSLVLSMVLFVHAIWHYYFFDLDITVDEPYPTSVFIQFNHYGYYLAVNLMLAAMLFVASKSLLRKILYLVCFGLNTVMLNLNMTFGAWLACAVGFIFAVIAYVIKDRRVSLKPVAVFAVFIAITVVMTLMGHGQLGDLLKFFGDIKEVVSDPSGANDAGTTRWALWKATAGYIRQRPLFGWGIEGIDEMLDKAAGSSRTHNEYLQYAATFGIPEAIAYSAALIGVIVRAIRKRSVLSGITLACLTVAFTYMVSACFGITLYNTTPYLFIFLGLGYGSLSIVKEEKP